MALILSAVYELMKRSRLGYARLSLSFLTIILLVCFKLSPIAIILGAGIGSIIYNMVRKG